MYMTKNELIINDTKLTYLYKNNNSKRTMLFIHGFNSSALFAEKLFDLDNNFNLILVNLPGSRENPIDREITLEEQSKIIWKFINKLNKKKIIVLGHSLGGSILAKIWKNRKIDELIFLSTIHPYMGEVATYRLLQKIKSGGSKLSKIPFDILLKGDSNKAIPKASDWVKAFMKPPVGLKDILHKEILNDEYIQTKLKGELLKIKKPMKFAVGSKDHIIGTKQFEEYVNNRLNKKVNSFPNSGHNPIKDRPKLVNEWLNGLYQKKRTRSKKSLLKRSFFTKRSH